MQSPHSCGYAQQRGQRQASTHARSLIGEPRSPGEDLGSRFSTNWYVQERTWRALQYLSGRVQVRHMRTRALLRTVGGTRCSMQTQG